ncbi:hypothetical protein ACFXAZ_37400 [Streptomyces sp. NPDC059477]|uniref:hypothetical protein n=1 Tax=Streptomyces sp. NPDC059477 TaxID=3346847 RepID=UPI0036954841
MAGRGRGPVVTGIGAETGSQSARARALAVLRVRSRALAVALLPAAAAVILLAGGSTGQFVGEGWDIARWVAGVLAVLVLAAAGVIALVVARARPAVTPTVAIPEGSAPDLYRLVRDLADRLDVPAPSAIALTPDCDSWLEDRTHPAQGGAPPSGHADEIAGVGRPHRRGSAAPVLVIGSPFLWWMRVGELRAVLAPVVAGTGPSAHPDIAAARRFVRGLDAAVAVTATAGRDPVSRAVLAGIGSVARMLLRACRVHAAEMERGVAAAAAERAQAVDYGLRIVAQEQVGLAYAGWDRLLTRVALPAWRMGRWPSRLDAGVVAALTELSRRDRLAEGFASRLGERPACDLLEEPGVIDEATSLLAARLFHGGPAEPGPDWSPVDWQEYPDEVVDRKWRTDAARLHRVLDALGVRRAGGPHSDAPTLDRVLSHLTEPAPAPESAPTRAPHPEPTPAPESAPTRAPHPEPTPAPATPTTHGPRPAQQPDDSRSRPTTATDEATGSPPVTDRPPASDTHTVTDSPSPIDPHTAPDSPSPSDSRTVTDPPSPTDVPTDTPEEAPSQDPFPEEDLIPTTTARSTTLAERLSSELAREEAAHAAQAAQDATSAQAADARATAPLPGADLWDDGTLPLFPLQPPRSPRELLADHVTAMVCCAAMDTAGAKPGLDWLDGPSLMVAGERSTDLTPKVLSLLEHGDPAPLRGWLTKVGIRPEKPVRLV